MSQIHVDHFPDRITLSNNLFRYEFSQATGGLPCSIGFADGIELLREDRPLLGLKVNRVDYSPSLRHSFDPAVVPGDNRIHIMFNDIPWEDEGGNRLPGYRLSLRYDIHEDGVVFAKTFFYTHTLTPGVIEGFTLRPSVTIPEKGEANWAYWEFPDAANAKLIQAINGFARNLPMGQDACFEEKILPFVSFDFGVGGRRDMHAEFFVESFNSLLPDEIRNTQTDIKWNGRTGSVLWEFQREGLSIRGRSYQWRNIWGWAVNCFPVERKHPPLRVFHYLDAFQPYPAEEIIQEASSEGANVFTLHEAWRLDWKNGEFPTDEQKLRDTIESIHRYGMRAVLYVRGNEDAIRLDHAEPLRPYLTKDWDGVYMDLGSPAFFLGLDEYSQGGRIHFREYHKLMHKIREFVGEEGIVFSHSGSFFASQAHTTIDAYVAGEQEKGQLIKDRTLHAYYSGLSVSPSALWTAAFPTYRTKAAVPYLAATAQTPFLALGTQIPASSLVHPKVPSVIGFQRPLWRLWELLDGQKDVRVYTRQNTEAIFETDDDAGACLIITRNGDVLLIATNFSDTRRVLQIDVNWKGLGIERHPACIELTAGYDSNSWRHFDSLELAAMVDGFGVTGWLFTDNATSWRDGLVHFARPYPSFPEREEDYHRTIEQIRRSRFDAPAWKECYLQVCIPNFPNTCEESLWFDLFENLLQLQEIDGDSSHRLLGYIGKGGLTAYPTPDCDHLIPGISSAWIPLHEVLDGAGEHALAIATKRGDGDFYNFIIGYLSPVTGPGTEMRELVYSNAVDSDWSIISFRVQMLED